MAYDSTSRPDGRNGVELSQTEMGDTVVLGLAEAIDFLQLLFDPVSVDVVQTLRDGRDLSSLSGYDSDAIRWHLKELMSSGIVREDGATPSIDPSGASATLSAIRTVLSAAA